MKQVCVIGLSAFGSHLARALVKFGCEVLVIDQDEERIAELRDDVHRAIIGDAREYEMLQSVLSGSVQTVVLSLGATNIEPSILCTLNVKRLGVETILSTARNEDHAQILRAVGATEIIFPEEETAIRVGRRVANPDLRDMFSLEGDYRIMEIVVPARLVGQTLASTDLRKEYDLLVLAIRPAGAEKFKFLPTATTKLQADDVLMVLGRELDLVRFGGFD